MAEATLIREARLAPGEIACEGRLRPVTEAGIEALIVSIKGEGGIRNPVHVRRVKARRGKGQELRLIAGAYRVAAADRLGIDVPAKIWDCTDDQAAMMEIDDQMAGEVLSAIDQAVFLGRRKAVYERLHPEVKAGVAGGRARQGSASEIISFAAATARQFRMSERHVQHFVRIGEVLSEHEINDLRGSEKPVGVVELIALAKIGDAAERRKVCTLISTGGAKTVSKALEAVKGVEPPVQSPVDLDLQRLLEAWGRASMAARRAFIEARGDEVAKLLGDAESEAA